uniref:Plastocyanin-like domain-containing protein n=1 Tax=Globisporangium ultimum (strain ATCC 200006 / CBS 805.95 / DAOM BR144) TaxID=431595 RepID=K3WQT4_GLOUD
MALAFSTAHALTNLKADWDAYASPLAIPEVIDMTAGGSLEMQIGRAKHNWTADGSVSGDIYGYARMNGTPSFPGPTIKVARGVPISVRWYNELSAPHLLDDSVESSLTTMESRCYPYCGVPVVVHVHGLESPAKYDGLPFRTIYKNQSQDMVYLNNQSSSTKLYHDHANGLTRLNVWSGLFGMYIIEDKAREAALNVNVETDVPLVIGDRLISNKGALMYSDDNCQGASVTKWVPESFGTVNLVNGVVMPYLDVPNAQVRFRVTNSANSRHYNFTIPFGDKCTVIAKDSGFVQKTESLSKFVILYPFERLELICDFSSSTNGTKWDVIDNPTVDQDTPYDPRVMRVRVDTSLKTSTMTTRQIPSELTKLKDLKALWKSLGGKQRAVFLGEMEYTLTCPSKSMIRYRDQEMNMTTIKNTLACTKGKVERWTFKNPTDDPHPFHWHLVNAQCGPSDDEVDTNALKDVVVIPNAGTRPSTSITQVCYVACTPDEFLVEGSTRGAKEYNFDTSEPYVAHCHILEHEENSMMSYFKLTELDDDAPDDDGIVEVTGVITSSVVWTAMGMSVLGGLATSMSVLVISVERLMFLSNPKSLAIAFSLSAGVMVFIAFADLWSEATTYYRATFTVGGVVDPEAYEHGGSTGDAGVCDDTCGGHAWLATIGAFTGGMVIILLVEYIVHRVLHHHGANHRESDAAALSPVQDKHLMTGNNGDMEKGDILESPVAGESDMTEAERAQKEEFKRAGVMSGIAIAIHNFPEGLALFVSSLQGLRTGLILSIGVILHNLPEGVAIAAPVYYATGSKLEAFKWTFLSGVAQPLGAAIGWAAVSGGLSFALQATLYAVVAGMLTCITLKELLPGAFRFDPSGKYFVTAFFCGIMIIAFGIMLLKYSGSG